MTNSDHKWYPCDHHHPLPHDDHHHHGARPGAAHCAIFAHLRLRPCGHRPLHGHAQELHGQLYSRLRWWSWRWWWWWRSWWRFHSIQKILWEHRPRFFCTDGKCFLANGAGREKPSVSPPTFCKTALSHQLGEIQMQFFWKAELNSRDHFSNICAALIFLKIFTLISLTMATN